MNLRALERGRRFSPDWERKLALLTVLGTGDELDPEFANIAAIKDPNGWDALLVRLKAIQKQRSYRPGWVIHQTMACGNPPYWVLVELAENAGYNSRWPSKQWSDYKGSFSPAPNFAAIDWVKWEELDKSEKKPVNRLVLLQKPKE
jgi:hypothetical protein